MTERQVQTKIKNYLEKKGAYVVKVVHANKAGVPDILCCYRGSFVGIEVKRPETIRKVTELQKVNLAEIVKCGGYSCVAASIEDVQAILEEVELENALCKM